MRVYQEDFGYEENCSPSEAENQTDYYKFPQNLCFYQGQLMAYQLSI